MKQKTVTITTAAHELKASRSSVYRWIDAEYLQAVKQAGGRYIIVNEAYKELRRVRG